MFSLIVMLIPAYRCDGHQFPCLGAALADVRMRMMAHKRDAKSRQDSFVNFNFLVASFASFQSWMATSWFWRCW